FDPRLFLELSDLARELVPHEILRPFEQVLLRLVDSHSGDALQLGELGLADGLLLLLKLTQMLLAIGEPLLAPCKLRQLPVDLLLLRDDALFDLDDPRPMVRDLGIDLGAETDGVLPRADLRLAPE